MKPLSNSISLPVSRNTNNPIKDCYNNILGFPSGSVVKNSPVNAGNIRDTGSIPGLGRSPREENGNPL